MQSIQAFLSSVVVGPAAGSADLSIFPLLRTVPAEPAYDTLQDAIRAGKAKVTEVSEAGHVPELRVVNDGGSSVLIVDGEELIGAKQNRIVNVTILVPPQSTLTIPVSCVEAGRWRTQSKEFASAERAYHASGRRAKVEQVSASMRMSSSRDSDQAAIWAEIEAKSARLGASSSTRAAAAMFDKMRERLDAFTTELHPLEGQVGAVFAIRGAIAGLDAFDSARTWARVMPGLVRSYGLDALDAAIGGNGFAKPEPALFLDALGNAPLETFPAVGLGSDVRLGGDGVIGGALVVDDNVVHLLAFPKHDAVRPQTRRRWGVQ
jgi:ARG/rhodanese/phosphatase superfamily protein